VDARALRDEARDDVAAEVVARRRVAAVVDQHALEHLALEDVVAHRDQRPARAAGHLGRVLRLLDEVDDPAALVDVDDAEAAGLAGRDRERGDGEVRVEVAVGLLHLLDVELVDVVTAEHGDVRRAGVTDEVEVLVHGVGRAAVPELAEAHLRRHDLDVLAEPAEPPVAGQVLDQARRHVLREHVDAPVPRVHEVRQDEVDDPVAAGERDAGLGAVDRERAEARPLAARHDHHERVLHALDGSKRATRVASSSPRERTTRAPAPARPVR